MSSSSMNDICAMSSLPTCNYNLAQTHVALNKVCTIIMSGSDFRQGRPFCRRESVRLRSHRKNIERAVDRRRAALTKPRLAVSAFHGANGRRDPCARAFGRKAATSSATFPGHLCA
jgi:hypothetical protein